MTKNTILCTLYDELFSIYEVDFFSFHSLYIWSCIVNTISRIQTEPEGEQERMREINRHQKANECVGCERVEIFL